MDEQRASRRAKKTPGNAALPAWWPTFAAFCASLVGLGLARFAYTPLLPAVIDAGWFNAGQAAYLGAANLAGYLLGALFAAPLASRFRPRTLLRSAMGLASVAILACAWPVGFGWFFIWRLLSGAAGGLLMVLAASTVLAQIPAARRGLASGIVFTGIGLGIAASGTLVPLMLLHGLRETWLGLGAIALFLTAAAWKHWPAQGPVAAPPHAVVIGRSERAALRLLCAQYALNAVGLVPHMIFLVDFVARGLGQGQDVGSQYWVVFGLGALVGPVLTGRLADRIGFGAALAWSYLIQAVAVATPALTTNTISLIGSAVVVGAFTPGVVTLVLGRVHDLLAHHAGAERSAWGQATTAFAALQAVAAFAFSYLLAHRHGDYATIFELGALALGLALALELSTTARRRARDRKR